jgi:hypothetical protein
MGYTIEKLDGYLEVRLSGNGSKLVLFKVIAELMRKDPKKKYPDLWIVDQEFQVPYGEYSGIAKALSHVFTKSLVPNKTAIVADNDFQKAQIELYGLELSRCLSINIRAFLTIEEAVAWIKTPRETQPAG